MYRVCTRNKTMRRLIILAGTPDQEEANHKQYRKGCIAGLENKLCIDINGEPLGKRAIRTYADHFDEIHIVGPARENQAALGFTTSETLMLGAELVYHNVGGRISQTLRRAANLIAAFNKPTYVAPNDLLPRRSDLEAFLERAEEENALLFTTPILADTIRETGFPKRFYRVKDGDEKVCCAFPQIWKVAPGIPFAPILAVADDFYQYRNNGAHRWGMYDFIHAGVQTYNSLSKDAQAWLGTLIRLLAHLSLATKLPLIPPLTLHKAALVLGSLDTTHYRPVSIGQPLDAPSLAMDGDTWEEVGVLRQLHNDGWYSGAVRNHSRTRTPLAAIESGQQRSERSQRQPAGSSIRPAAVGRVHAFHNP